VLRRTFVDSVKSKGLSIRYKDTFIADIEKQGSTIKFEANILG
jgi:hypothetical protein